MVIGEEDGSDSFQRRPGQRRQQRLAVAGWAASAARGEEGVVALGDVGSGCARGGFSLSRARGRWGVSREREGEGSRGRDAGGGFGCVARRRVQDETRGEFGLGRGGRRGVAFHLADGVLRERGSDGDRNSDGEGDRTGRGPAATASAAGTASAASATRTATTTATARTGTATTATVGARFECGDVGRDSTERFEGAVGDEVRDRGQQQRQGRRQQLQRRGRQRQHQRRPGTATTARTGTATTATATAGAMASCVEGRRERRPRGTAPQTATQDGRTE